MEVGGAGAHHHQEDPDEVDTIATVPGVVLVQEHQEGRHHEEEDIGDGVDELRNVGREGVVLLAPVDRTGASLQVFPHTDFAITSEGVTVVSTQCSLSIDIFICIYKYIYI